MSAEKGNIIEAASLSKYYGDFLAVDDIDFCVRRGEIFGFLGPNGAGKTTTIRMLTGIFEPTEGRIFVNGYDMGKDALSAKQIMGIVPEMANAYVDLSAYKNMVLIGELYGVGKQKINERTENLLKLFGLYERMHEKVKTFSKGMKQRLILAMSLINDPELLFLDEPTSGLDVESVRMIRELIRKFNDGGTTIILTTHNIEEADKLCDKVAIMNHGKIVAIDRPARLKNIIKSTSSIEVAFEKKADMGKLGFRGVEEVKRVGDKIRLYSKTPEEILPPLFEYSKSSKNRILSINTLGPNLEDIFVKLTSEEK
jgi:ABC-2 type transport system ATP-binding protein